MKKVGYILLAAVIAVTFSGCRAGEILEDIISSPTPVAESAAPLSPNISTAPSALPGASDAPAEGGTVSPLPTDGGLVSASPDAAATPR